MDSQIFHDENTWLRAFLDRLITLIRAMLLIGGTVAILTGCEKLLPPNPSPDPTPAPVPVAAAWVIVVEETSQRTPETALLLADPWWQSLAARSIRFRWYDRDSQEAASAVKALGSTQLPALLLLDQTGRVTHRGPLPATTAAIAALMK